MIICEREETLDSLGHGQEGELSTYYNFRWGRELVKRLGTAIL